MEYNKENKIAVKGSGAYQRYDGSSWKLVTLPWASSYDEDDCKVQSTNSREDTWLGDTKAPRPTATRLEVSQEFARPTSYDPRCENSLPSPGHQLPEAVIPRMHIIWF